jgi:hypothetical protein
MLLEDEKRKQRNINLYGDWYKNFWPGFFRNEGGMINARPGYQGGGLMGNSLLGMQSGGSASVARAKKIRKAFDAFQKKARNIRKKQGSSKLWSLVGNIGGKYLLPAALAALGPASWGASLASKGILSLLAKSAGSGLGSYFGAKQERGVASGATTFALGAIEGQLKGLGDKWKPDVGKKPMGGGMASSKLPGGGDLSKAYKGSPTGYSGGVAGAGAFEYKPSGFGAGRKALGNQSLIGGSDLSKAYAGSPAGYSGGWSPQFIPGVLEPEVDPLSALEEELSMMDFGSNVGHGIAGGQQGGMVRDDMALLDMIYRR